MKEQKPKQPRGRPCVYTDAAAESICAQLADGLSLRKICSADGMPKESTVRNWVADDVSGFAARYARAREIGYERLAEELLEIADTPLIGIKTKTNEKGEVETQEADMIEHRRLQVDTRKWMLAKMLPKRYGDKFAVGGADDLPPIKQQEVEPQDIARRFAFVLRKGIALAAAANEPKTTSAEKASKG